MVLEPRRRKLLKQKPHKKQFVSARAQSLAFTSSNICLICAHLPDMDRLFEQGIGNIYSIQIERTLYCSA